MELAKQHSKSAMDAKRLRKMRVWISARSSSHLASWRAQMAMRDAVSMGEDISGSKNVASVMSRGRSGSTLWEMKYGE